MGLLIRHADDRTLDLGNTINKSVNLDYFKLDNMNASAIKTQVEHYLPLLSAKQQALVLEMIKSLLNVDADTKRISRKQYNQELNDAVKRIENGKAISHKEAENELSKW